MKKATFKRLRDVLRSQENILMAKIETMPDGLATLKLAGEEKAISDALSMAQGKKADSALSPAYLAKLSANAQNYGLWASRAARLGPNPGGRKGVAYYRSASETLNDLASDPGGKLDAYEKQQEKFERGGR